MLITIAFYTIKRLISSHLTKIVKKFTTACYDCTLVYLTDRDSKPICVNVRVDSLISA